MRFSIITVCLNCESLIESTVRSVLEQDFADYEFWIVDGGSTDRTLAAATGYQGAFQGRMHISSEADQGIFDAMNRGVGLSGGEYLYFLNCGDRLLPGTLAAVDAAIRRHPGCMVYYGDTQLLNDNGGEVMVVRNNADKLKRMPIHHQGCFFARGCHQKYGNYSLTYPMAADYDLMLDMHLHGEEFYHIGQIIADFRGFGASANNEQTVRDLYNIKFRRRIIGRQHKNFGELFYTTQIKTIKWIDKWRKLLK